MKCFWTTSKLKWLIPPLLPCSTINKAIEISQQGLVGAPSKNFIQDSMDPHQLMQQHLPLGTTQFHLLQAMLSGLLLQGQQPIPGPSSPLPLESLARFVVSLTIWPWIVFIGWITPSKAGSLQLNCRQWWLTTTLSLKIKNGMLIVLQKHISLMS